MSTRGKQCPDSWKDPRSKAHCHCTKVLPIEDWHSDWVSWSGYRSTKIIETRIGAEFQLRQVIIGTPKRGQLGVVIGLQLSQLIPVTAEDDQSRIATQVQTFYFVRVAPNSQQLWVLRQVQWFQIIFRACEIGQIRVFRYIDSRCTGRLTAQSVVLP